MQDLRLCVISSSEINTYSFIVDFIRSNSLCTILENKAEVIEYRDTEAEVVMVSHCRIPGYRGFT